MSWAGWRLGAAHVRLHASNKVKTSQMRMALILVGIWGYLSACFLGFHQTPRHGVKNHLNSAEMVLLSTAGLNFHPVLEANAGFFPSFPWFKSSPQVIHCI